MKNSQALGNIPLETLLQGVAANGLSGAFCASAEAPGDRLQSIVIVLREGRLLARPGLVRAMRRVLRATYLEWAWCPMAVKDAPTEDVQAVLFEVARLNDEQSRNVARG